MKLENSDLELRAIKTICEGKPRAQAQLLGRLNKTFFNYGATADAYDRIMRLSKKRSLIPSWEDLTTDQTIPDSSRKILRMYKKKPVILARANTLVENLNKYRRARMLALMYGDGLDKLRDKQVDIDELMENASETITKARGGSSLEQSIVHIGTNSNVKSLLKKILYPKINKFIPTGFKGWDDINSGLIRGNLIAVGARTNQGKSAFLLQLSKNMALAGARVGNIQLEMDGEETLQRRVANISGIKLTNIINPKNRLSKEDKRKITKCLMQYDKKLNNIRACEDYIVPEEDLTIQELLYSIRSYKYDVIIIDYLGLLNGLQGDKQWQMMGEATRFAKLFAKRENCVVIFAAQLDDLSGSIRYSRTMKEHSNTMFSWNLDEEARERHILEINTEKARQQQKIIFELKEDFSTMRLEDGERTGRVVYTKSNPRRNHNKDQKRDGFKKKKEEPALHKKWSTK